MSGVIIFGATSTIAIETAKLLADSGRTIALVGRRAEELEVVARDLRGRGAAVRVKVADLGEPDQYETLFRSVVEETGDTDLFLIAHGTLTDQRAAEKDLSLFRREMETNFLSPLCLAALAANYLEARGKGTLAVIASVAGLRGRQSNYIYGSAKAGLIAFLSGMRNRLSRKGVHVVTILSGLVATKMTQHLRQNALFADPKGVAQTIVRGIEKRKNVVYTPWFWRFIMCGIVHIPETVFKRMKL